MDAMDVSILQEATPFKDSSPSLSSAPPELTGGIRSSSNQDSDDELQKELTCSMENYRRFSSRVRKMPEFFGIGATSGIVGLKRKRDGTMVKRRLDFDALHVQKVAVVAAELMEPTSQERPDAQESADPEDTGNANEQMETPEVWIVDSLGYSHLRVVVILLLPSLNLFLECLFCWFVF